MWFRAGLPRHLTTCGGAAKLSEEENSSRIYQSECFQSQRLECMVEVMYILRISWLRHALLRHLTGKEHEIGLCQCIDYSEILCHCFASMPRNQSAAVGAFTVNSDKTRRLFHGWDINWPCVDFVMASRPAKSQTT